jgi:integrase
MPLPLKSFRRASKNEDGRLIYLTQDLRALLAQQWQDRQAHYPECPFVFHDHGRRIANYYKRWHQACQEAGLHGKIPHDFRRTAVRNMVRAGIPERVAMMISGHKTRSIFDRYHIVSDRDLKEAAQRLENAVSPLNGDHFGDHSVTADTQSSVSH